jgi:pimeloyl-ACP methyl ester carboxylesterase
MALSIQRLGTQAFDAPSQAKRSTPAKASPPKKEKHSPSVGTKVAWGAGILATVAVAPRLLLHLVPKSTWQNVEEMLLYPGISDDWIPKNKKYMDDLFTRSQEKLPQLESHKISLGKNLSTLAWYHPAKDGKPTLLVSLGNAERFDSLQDYIDYVKQGYGITLYEYPGYGTTEGKPTQASLIETAKAVSDFLAKKKKTPTTEQVLVGHSLGCNVSVHLAKDAQYKALILNSPMNSLAGAMRERFGFLMQWIPIQNHAPSPWKNDEILKNLKTPVFVTAFQEDPIIPMASSEKLYKAATAPNKKWHLIESKGHVIPLDEILGKVTAFLEGISSPTGNSSSNRTK